MAIIFVDSTATGADNGTSWTDAYPSLTTAMLAANIAPGDQLLVSGTFNESVDIVEAAAVATPTLVQGDDKSGGAGVGVAATFTIDGQSTRSSGLVSSVGAGSAYYVFKDMKVTGATGTGVSMGTTDAITFKRCEFTNNGGWGVQCDNEYLFEECIFSLAQANGGIDSDNSIGFVGCKFYNNVGEGLRMNYGLVYACEFFSNSGDNIRLTSGVNFQAILNNTIDGDGRDSDNGMSFTSSILNIIAMVNNIIYANTTGVTAAVDAGELTISRNNLLYDNTTDYVKSNTHSGEVTSAPVFNSEVGNDYTLHLSSPAKAAGADAGEVANGVSYTDIGAHQRQEPAGGGGMRLVDGGLVG